MQLTIIHHTNSSIVLKAIGPLGETYKQLSMTVDMFIESMELVDAGESIENCFPNLSSIEHKFLMSGETDNSMEDFFDSHIDNNNNNNFQVSGIEHNCEIE
jgi:hypothetical protein